jgi:hypothetical protein
MFLTRYEDDVKSIKKNQTFDVLSGMLKTRNQKIENQRVLKIYKTDLMIYYIL